MLSEEAKKELKALASSRQLRQDFERVRVAASAAQEAMSLDAFVQFLTDMSRMFPLPAPRVPLAYHVVLI